MLAHFHVPMGWWELLKRTGKEAIADDVLNLAAQQAYYFFFALFPLLLALLAFASFFPISNLTDELFRLLGDVMPGDVLKMITTQLDKISEQNAGGLLTFAFLVTIWSSSGAVVSMCTTLNAAYDITESRPWWKVRLTAIALTVGLSLFILTSMALVVAGPWMADKVADVSGLGPAFAWTWKIVQWPLVFVLVATGIAILYYFAPDAEQEFVWLTPGSVLATLIWVVISLAFNVYVKNFGAYTETYGAIGAVMVLMLWFYLSGIAILLGAELNAEIEHASPYGKAPGEKVPGEKKKIGPRAMKAYEERVARGEAPAQVFADDENCDLDRAPAKRPAEDQPMKPSDLLIGTAALLPAALKIGRDIRDKVRNDKGRAA